MSHKRVAQSFLSLITILLLNSCVTFKPLPVQLDRFDRAVEVSASELDGIYDITQLRVGSTVVLRNKAAHSRHWGLVSYKLTALDNATQRYIVDLTALDHDANGLITAFEVGPLFIRRIFMSGRAKTLNVVRVDSKQIDSKICDSIVKNLIIGGIPGLLLDLIKIYRHETVMDRFVQAATGHDDYYKIVNLTRMADEELTVGDRHLSCKVFQIEYLAKVISVSSKQPEPWYVIKDVSGQVWVSDDVPFGTVKRNVKTTTHLGAEEFGIKRKPFETNMITELVDFKY